MTDEEADLEIEIARARAKAQKTPVAPAPAVAAPSEPAALSPESQSGTAMRSFGRGASLGFTPALAGVSGALQELGSRGPLGRIASLAAPVAMGPLAGPAMLASAGSAPEVLTGSDEQLGEFRDSGVMEAMIQRFRADRDRARVDQERGARANPKTAMAAEVAGAMATPGPKGGTLGGRMAGYTGQGALMGAATAASKPDGGASDVGLGALTGFLGGGMGEGISAVGRGVIRKGAGVVGDIVQGRAAKDAADVAKEVASLQGTASNQKGVAWRELENVGNGLRGVPVSSSPAGITPQLQSELIQTLNSPEASALQVSLLQNAKESIPGQLSAWQKSLAAAQAAKAAAPAETAKRTQDYFNDSLWRTEVAPRMGRLAQRGGLALGMGALSGAVGAAGGAASGIDPLKAGAIGMTTGFGSVLGAQGLLTMARAAAASPRLQRAGVEGAISGVQQAGELSTRMGAGGVAYLDSKSIADPMGPLRQYLGLSPEERKEADADAFTRGQ